MTEHKIPIRGENAAFFVNGAKRGESVMLLYPDQLTAVIIGSVRVWIYVGAPVVYLAVWFLVFHTIGFGPVAVWYLVGWWVWRALDKRRAARKAAAGGDSVTVIPLDQVTSVRRRKVRNAVSWLGLTNLTVTTADGTEYGFGGLMEQWPSYLADALTARGREVHVESETITVIGAGPGDSPLMSLLEYVISLGHNLDITSGHGQAVITRSPGIAGELYAYRTHRGRADRRAPRQHAAWTTRG